MTHSGYLFHIQYLGFRYHGWMKQPGLKTIESMLEKTAKQVLGQRPFRILGCSRTDAMVSANHTAFELFVDDPYDPAVLEHQFNLNLPNDIRVIKVEPVSNRFNIIQSVKCKEYIYLFSCGKKAHPFSAGMSFSFLDTLDIELMQQGALLFEGTHDFRQYCTKPGKKTIFNRTIDVARIEQNNRFQASFLDDPVWMFRVQSKGFMRNQVRLMMGQLIRLGKRQISLDDIRESIKGIPSDPLGVIAPASGLILNRVEFDFDDI